MFHITHVSHVYSMLLKKLVFNTDNLICRLTNLLFHNFSSVIKLASAFGIRTKISFFAVKVMLQCCSGICKSFNIFIVFFGSQCISSNNVLQRAPLPNCLAHPISLFGLQWTNVRPHTVTLWPVYRGNKQAYGNAVIFNTAIFLWYRYIAHPYHHAKKQRQLDDVRT